jgi:hypothetical protein
LANLLRLDTERVRLGFVESIFPNATQAASTNLIWCPACAKHGFHSPAFQLNFSSICPLHGLALLRRCTQCSSPIPYRLSSTIRYELFRCPRCTKDFALTLRSPGRALEMNANSAALFTDYSDLIRFSDQLPTMINTCRALVGRPYMPLLISKPDIYRRSASFRQFVADVLVSVSQHNCNDAQVNLHLLNPSFTFAGPYSYDEKPREHNATRAIKSVTAQTDIKLEDAWTIYRCVRRHLWRHHVCQHRSCARLAMKTLWWDLEGERTATFCPAAIGFLRWRMQWEGCRIPSQLDNPQRPRTPWGLVGWISGESPVASPLWTKSFEIWLNAHILACVCFDSFDGWLTLSMSSEVKGKMRWSSQDHERFFKRHWASSGRGTFTEPGLFFIESPIEKPTAIPSGGAGHKLLTARALAAFMR